MKLIYTSTDYTKIKVIESALAANQVKFITKGEDLDVLNAMIPRHSNLIEIYVSDQDYSKALEIIENGSALEDSPEEDPFPTQRYNRYRELTKLNAKKDTKFLLTIISAVLFISNLYFLLLYTLEKDKFQKYKNSMESELYDYVFDEDSYCTSTLYKKMRKVIQISCYDKETDQILSQKNYDQSEILTYESFNPYLLDFFTIQRSYDINGIKTAEFADNDQDGEFDEYIIFDQKGSKVKRYLDKNRDHRFDESEIVD
ncbi:putative signal transducing protein [Leptospira brenneri]|uniref:DUF2007 domain-containing protein n=1 Tax=Leptospira brenneri TaxID=2023182 RepID=A0A2M9Y482_9LEPT|nr:DUF2007 domain-containing protein [Leptospira brenneri]PJZ46391.1 hypothetical protein CH361_04665 [Leptospira brenneri]TGK96493.1 DUF2007 domain-containing protein [Leptospira brenneri]